MTYSFYSLTTGRFDGSGGATANPPEGKGAVEGLFDRSQWAVDLSTGAVIQIDREVPTKPADSPDLIWSFDTPTWQWTSTPSHAAQDASARANRAELMARFDGWLMRTVRTGEPAPAPVLAYLADLANLTSDPNWPNPSWPTPPSGY